LIEYEQIVLQLKMNFCNYLYLKNTHTQNIINFYLVVNR